MGHHHKGKPGKGKDPGKLNLRWITESNAIDNDAVQWTEDAGKYLAKCGLTTSGLRRFFGEVRRIQTDFQSFQEDVQLLRAKLAYDANRKGKEGVQEFYDLMKDGIIAIEKDEARFNRFVKLCEAIVAFHRVHGGSTK